MPELPDVEGYRRALTQVLPGRRVEHVHVGDAGVLRNASARSFGRQLRGRTFTTPGRHGKWLLLPTDGPTLIVHSGMTGRPYYAPAGAEPERFDRVRLDLDDGEFRYNDLRKLRGLWVVAEGAEDRVIGETGPDALGLSTAGLEAALTGLRRALKTALTDQSVIAGLGNLLADEICWQARIDPLRRCDDLSDAERAELAKALRRVLRTSVRHGCVPRLRTWLTGNRDDADAACPRCGTPLRNRRVNGRRTVSCPNEQR